MRVAIGGILTALMMLLTLISDISEQLLPLWVAGIVGWCAVFLLFADVKKSQRYQTTVIIVVGLILLTAGQAQDGSAQWVQAIGNNAGLVSMLASVGFLRLIALPANVAKNAANASDKNQNASLPVGFRAYVKTLAGVCLFGSVINISAPILFADRLYKHDALGRLASQSITRVFTSTSTWSPFFGGMAAVLISVPDMRLGFVIIACIPFAIASFVVVVLEVRLRYWQQVQTFKGYPVNFYNLWIPAALASIILVLTRLAPAWSVLTHISLSALILSIVVLWWRERVGAVKSLARFVVEGLPTMVNELQLFLAAGVLAAGLATMISDGFLPVLPDFTASAAAVLLGAMILLAVLGVHPVVLVTGATPLILSLNPQPDLLAVCYLLAWGLGTCASPLSGTHLVFQGRYGIPSWKGALWNWSYVAFMYLLAVLLLYVVASVL